MSPRKIICVGVLVAACGPSVDAPPAPEPIVKQCSAFCEKIEDECGYGPVGSSFKTFDVELWEDCPRDCTDAVPRDHPCRTEALAMKACQASQTCDQLRSEYVDGVLPPEGEDACGTERAAVHLCQVEYAPGPGYED